MSDILKDIQAQREEIDTILSLDEESPSHRQINFLLSDLESSQTPDEIRKDILFNYPNYDLITFYDVWHLVKSFHLPIDPRKHFVNFVKNMAWIGLTKL